MYHLSKAKYRLLEKVSRKGIISALAFDQRGALKRMMAAHQDTEPAPWQIEALKALVSEELTPYASSILLDPEYGLPATKVRDQKSGLLLAYEQTGYDTTTTSRLPDCLVDWSVKRLKEAGADAVKFLLYYDVDGDEYINQQKQAYIERIGSECQAEEIPFFLELLTYDEAILDNQSVAFAKLKAHKVNEAMKVFSAERFGVDVLKVEVPVNMAYVEGFAEGEVVYSKEEAMQAFRDQEAASHLPYIYLSAGVSASLFQETLVFAAEAGARFNGVLCGRATWSGAVAVYMSEGEEAARQWLRTEGFQNIDRLNQVLERTASPWTTKLTLEEA
ncbi:tagatose 1,6-diphosphate aldolase [Streptococcus equi subsp. zooepidemicus SzS31A1]|uniref:Tagatose 1,6-diphosphate aldolase n=4 Tax=Streptococcus equi TaxID=1336 RepID=A0ABR4RSU8_STRSZ|nr:tagatose-bisphosphate aldolase [Streptococcus equi]KIS18133.1 tagatose 1,6-diphosphate aldolase [Streptococcus equi subsp. zooepidemicus Sz4is]HEL0120349.1 tagatose-bisphosphate aldolase [Streptococcus equi subsp. zooepidemicus]KDE01967.1 tagatose 1,6-diphosphate aldolase [Streptococcus equi subsp. zooepidemicus SzS31A1]KIS07355.1 tagatose 1,6-diphosphate aldolase [Streptococcus equi subsp. zooepidemicus Sz12is]HEL0124296.1 tagatose-bisphosphate aldolase [Streptococcus equi subsp. zooepidem